MGTPRNSTDVGIDQYVGEAFRTELHRQRITQVAVAQRLHITQPTVSARLNGATPLSASEIATLAAMCGRPVGYFFPTDEQLESFRREVGDRMSVTREYLTLVDLHTPDDGATVLPFERRRRPLTA